MLSKARLNLVRVDAGAAGPEVMTAVANLEKFLAPSQEAFSDEQRASALELIERAAGEPARRHVNAQAIVEAAGRVLAPAERARGTW